MSVVDTDRSSESPIVRVTGRVRRTAGDPNSVIIFCTDTLILILIVSNGASGATILSAALCALAFKLSELATTYKRKSRKDILLFIAVSVATQALALGFLTISILESLWWRDKRF